VHVAKLKETAQAPPYQHTPPGSMSSGE
jgi:hypothetical protein